MTPRQRAGLREDRQAIAQGYLRALQLARDPVLGAPLRGRLLSAAAEAAPALSGLLSRDERAAVRAALRGPALDGATAGAARTIDAAMRRTDCAGYCAL